MTEVVGIYARISEDPLQQEKGVTRQLEDGRALAQSRGWTVRDEWVDNDLSALRGGPRPAYQALIEAAERGEITRIVAYGMARLWRNRRERADGIERLSKARVSIALVKGNDLDLTSAAGRVVAGLLGEFDTMESEIKGERVARAALQRAEEGRANGAVAYGWRRIYERDANGRVLSFKDEIDEDSAAIVREIVDRLLARESLNAITADLNARDVPTPYGDGRSWRTSSVRKLALRLSNIARRKRDGEDFGPAAWPPIVDQDKHDQVVALLTDPSRVQTRGGARQHLLTFGIGRCGKCGSQLRVSHRWVNSRRKELGKKPLYVCDSTASCVGRRQEWVDDLVERVVVRRLQEPDARDLLTRDDSAAKAAREHAAGIRARLDAAAVDYADGVLDREQLRRISEKLSPELQKAEREALRLVVGMPSDLVAGMVGPQAEERWKQLNVLQRRALLEAMGVTVTIIPSRGGPGFKPESVDIHFEPDDESEPDAIRNMPAEALDVHS
ncbi:serine recombinase [Lentzea sp. NBRC 105346]|uniref:recombinase family protein n=1 Tax=Lentzea sp. NBRC 105346 TaxID=3032205 RepID=UPI0024A3055F|nr:recombinase family protein [Lentzea sp. NBRC 105346]GLZ29387.1 serine recombinase [Lentzea sp. NBRC 105346]